MNIYSTAAVLAAVAMSVPMVCQAQDPASVYSQIQKLSAAGKTAEAVELCNQVLKTFSNTKSRVGRQFAYMMPYFYWQKGSLLSAQKDYSGAYDTFKELYEKEDFRDKNLIQTAKTNTGQEEGYVPFLTASLFQMGYNRFLEASGDDKTPGKPELFAEAIPALEDYLGLIRAGKVSASEKKQKLEGKICFLLLQAYLLKPEPDFKKAGEYLAESRKAKEKLPDDMAMSGLNTIVSIALKNPEYISWVPRVISANPESFNLTPERAARHASKFLNAGIKASQAVSTALRKDDRENAHGAAQAVSNLFALVPNLPDVRGTLKNNIAAIGSFDKLIVDTTTNNRLIKSEQEALLKMYNKLASDNTQLEAFAVLTMANTALLYGSNRLGKAGYQLVVDRFPELSQPKGDKTESMKDKNLYQLSALCRVTGDEEAAVKIEERLAKSGSKIGANNIIVNKMARLVKQQDWENVIPAADEVMDFYKSEPTGQYYVSAQFSKLAALYKLGRFQEVVDEGGKLLESGNIKAGAGKLSEKQAKTYDSQANFFVMDAYNRLSKVDAQNLDKALESFARYIEKHPSLDLKENALAANAYYSAIDSLLKRQGHGDEAEQEKDMQKALEYCKVIADNWPKHAVYPVAQLMRGSILINGKDEALKPEGITVLEECTEGALGQPDGKGKGTAANALYWLASFGPELPREGEDQAAVDARVKGYIDRFWAEADEPGNPYSLQMSTLELRRAARGTDAAAYNASLKRAQEIIGREATHSFKKNELNSELEAAINDYVAAFVDGNRKLNNKEFTLQEKAEHFTNFPGLEKDDKYSHAILRMAMINSMNEEAAAEKDTDKRAKLIADVETAFRDMTNTFKPADLTSYICVQVGNYLVDYVSRFDNPSSKQAELDEAAAYFNEVVTLGREQVPAAKLGLANALALTGDAGKQKTALASYEELSKSTDRTVSGPALIGATKLHMAMGAADKAVETASKFINDRGNTAGRLDMLMLLASAYEQSGDTAKALTTYMNLYNQNQGNVTYSAPACLAMTELMWKRNNPTSGDRMAGNFKQSDRWTAWNTASQYVAILKRSGFEAKMSRADSDKYKKVVEALGRYGADAAVQREEKERRDFQARAKRK